MARGMNPDRSRHRREAGIWGGATYEPCRREGLGAQPRRM